MDSLAVSILDCTGTWTGPIQRAVGMLSLSVSPNSEQRLVDQIVAGIKRQIQDRNGTLIKYEQEPRG
jgi:hypothetical protein